MSQEDHRLRHLERHTFFDKKKVHWRRANTLKYQLGTPLYDRKLAMAAGHNRAHHIVYTFSDYLVITLWGSGELARVHRETMALNYIATAPAVNPYHLCYDPDRDRVWVVCTDGNLLEVQVDPFAIQSQTALPGAHVPALYIIYAAGYLWVGMSNNLIRVDPDNPALQTTINTATGSIRGLCYDGTYVWCAASASIDRVHATTLVVNNYAINLPVADDSLWAMEFDGSNIWSCGPNAPDTCYLVKFDPQTLTYRTYDLSVMVGDDVEWGHVMLFDGEYLHIGLEDSPGYVMSLNTSSCEITYTTPFNNIHGIAYDGLYLWFVGDESPGNVGRILRSPPVSGIWKGETDTFATSAIGQQTVSIAFGGNLGEPPLVMVGLTDVTDMTTEIVSVCALNVLGTGFDCSCRVAAAGAGGSTAKFTYIVVIKHNVYSW